MEPAGSGATWTGSPKGIFEGRNYHKSRQSLKTIRREREDVNHTRVAGNRDEVEGVVANSLGLYRNGTSLLAKTFGVGLIGWLDAYVS